MLSIIIPTLNEEKSLATLLESIKKQNYNDYEIIVADAGSVDRTLEIAKEYNCRIIPGGLPAKGRNDGAKVAKGNLLLFLDADAVLPNNFFERSLEEFKKRKLQIAAFCLLPLPKKRIKSFAFNFFYNWPILILENILPHLSQGAFVERELFKKLNGYDESIKIAEDHDLARRAKKIGKYGIIRATKVFVSDRRFKKDGWFRTALKYLFCELHMIFIGPVKSDIFKYKFNHYKNKNENPKS